MKSSIDEISIRAKSVITLGDGELASGKLSRGRWTQLLPGNREFTEREGRLIVIEKFPVVGHNPENCGRENEFTTTLDARNFKFHPLLFFPTFPTLLCLRVLRQLLPRVRSNGKVNPRGFSSQPPLESRFFLKYRYTIRCNISSLRFVILWNDGWRFFLRRWSELEIVSMEYEWWRWVRFLELLNIRNYFYSLGNWRQREGK